MGRAHPGPFTILVIDDDLDILETITELLAMDGHRALATSGGADGLTQARSERPDLILVDYHMPRDGWFSRGRTAEGRRGDPADSGGRPDRGDGRAREQAQPGRVYRLHPEALRPGDVPPSRRRVPERNGWEESAHQRRASRTLIKPPPQALEPSRGFVANVATR